MFYILLISLSLLGSAHPAPSLRQARTITPISKHELSLALVEAHRLEIGRDPSKARLSMALAQVFLETCRGRCMVAWNLANIGAAKDEAFTMTGGARHAAYPDPITGARAYWRLLLARCSRALMLFDTGLSDLVAGALRRCGFYRAPVDQYAAGLRSLSAEPL